MATTDRLKCIYVHIILTKQGINIYEMCLWMFCIYGESNAIFRFKIKCQETAWNSYLLRCLSFLTLNIIRWPEIFHRPPIFFKAQGYTKCDLNVGRNHIAWLDHICCQGLLHSAFIQVDELISGHRHECSGSCCQIWRVCLIPDTCLIE